MCTEHIEFLSAARLRILKKGGLSCFWEKKGLHSSYISVPSARVTSDDSVKAALVAMHHSRGAQLSDPSLCLRNDKNLQCGNSVDKSQHQRASIFASLGTQVDLVKFWSDFSVRQRRNNLTARGKFKHRTFALLPPFERRQYNLYVQTEAVSLAVK